MLRRDPYIVVVPRTGTCARVLLFALALLTTACAPPSTLAVTVTGAPASVRPLLLYSGQRDGACRNFESTAVTGSVPVTYNAVWLDAACGAEFNVFTPSAGAFGRRVQTGNSADVLWLLDAIAAGQLSIAPPPLTRVPITIWLVASNRDLPSATKMRDRQVLSADALLQDLGAGLALDIRDKTLPVGSITPDCAASGSITTSANFDADRINVYYVKWYRNAPHSSAGYTCWEPGHPEVVFAAWGDASNADVVLAHELGHALGLIHEKASTAATLGWGHTTGVPGFDAFNLMGADGVTVTNISVGQMYNMNFGKDSWLNRTPATTRPVVRICQDSFAAGECPPLTLFVPGWPP